MEKLKYHLEEFILNSRLEGKRKAQIIQVLCLNYNKNITNDIKIELDKLNAYILNYDIIENLIKKISCKYAPEILQEIELIRKSIIELKIDFHKLSTYIINQAKENGDLK